ncbi:GTP-binding protein [Salipiger sp. P9]|uniref:CobW family GTP-binding protein n=1 Tax=Salipiger pentaromativorans TaxID=2943193 RepID=UPI0021589E0E|nr:GTP-binding protein [Salipiger pentaromativorans]MCR8549160.1 GTP-binding protein [Salipiger pentaromativorans]
MAADAPVPLLSICGFLGAGKTTLVNRLLATASGRRIVVFVNDFGAINIDLDLVETVTEDRISLKNGCVCCTLNADFLLQVKTLTRQEAPPDAILVEASGVTDPVALDGSLREVEAAGLVTRDASIYMIDAEQVGALDYIDTELLLDHANVCELVLVNKTDLVDAARLTAIEEMLAVSAPYAHVLKTRHADVAFLPLLELAGMGARGQPKLPHRVTPGHDFTSWTFEAPHPVPRERFEALARLMSSQCLRAKGFVIFADAPEEPRLFNMVGKRATLEPVSQSVTGGCRLVALGLKTRVDPESLARVMREV